MATWLVTGANRGIGLELCRGLEARGEDVIAVCRTVSEQLAGLGCEIVDGVDVAAPDASARLDAALGAERTLDVVVHNAGVLRRDALGELDADGLREHLEVNAIAPLLLTQALLPRLRAGGKIAFVSSRAGSIGDGPSGGLYGYRISKAALNMVGANLAHELAPRGIHVVLLHPGYVRTDMTGGSGNVDPVDSAAGLIERIDELDAERTGRFVLWNGGPVEW